MPVITKCPSCGRDVNSDICESCGTKAPGGSSAFEPAQELVWHYESKGERHGPVSDENIRSLIETDVLFRHSLIWRDGWVNWKPIAESELRDAFSGPPPLTGSAIDNSIVWALAFAPLIGAVLESIIGGALGFAASRLWWITLSLNIGLSAWDEKKLKSAGHNTKALALGASWLIPIYLYKRAKALHQSPAILVVWCATFALVFALPVMKLDPGDYVRAMFQDEVSVVKTGTLELCKSKTVGQMADGFLSNPRWESGTTEDGQKFVNVSGGITFREEPADVKIQFFVNSDKETFEYNAMEIAGESQNLIVARVLLNKMCEQD